MGLHARQPPASVCATGEHVQRIACGDVEPREQLANAEVVQRGKSLWRTGHMGHVCLDGGHELHCSCRPQEHECVTTRNMYLPRIHTQSIEHGRWLSCEHLAPCRSSLTHTLHVLPEFVQRCRYIVWSASEKSRFLTVSCSKSPGFGEPCAIVCIALPSSAHLCWPPLSIDRTACENPILSSFACVFCAADYFFSL